MRSSPPRSSALGSTQTVEGLVHAVADLLREMENPQLEARDLIAALFDVPRHWPVLRANKWVEAADWQRAMVAAARRGRGEPLEYAVGRASFRQWTLEVDGRVLIPRPETELLVDLVLREAKSAGTVVDVGTGSGAIAIALALEGAGRFDRVIATDISLDALTVARANARRLEAGVEFRVGDLLAPLESERDVQVVVSNPPYISYDEIAALPSSVRDWEPAVALFSADGGLAATARLVRQAGDVLRTAGGLLALEVDARRASLVAEFVSSDLRFGDVTVKLDLAGRERFVLARRRTEERQ